MLRTDHACLKDQASARNAIMGYRTAAFTDVRPLYFFGVEIRRSQRTAP
jgi:hypothetical protein